MRIRAATLNTWGLPALFAEDVAIRLREIGRRLPRLELDAIAFQEVWTAEAQRVLVDAGARAHLDHHWHGDSGLRGSGLLVLSRHPIESVRFERYLLHGDPSVGDYYGGKGFAELSLRTPAGLLVLVDTHLHARYANSVDHQYRVHRIGQIVQLAASARSVSEPLLVAGDFNLEESSDEYDVLLGLIGVRDTAAEMGRREPTVMRENPYRSQSSKPDRRIDLLLARSGVETGIRLHHVERIFDEPFDYSGRQLACSNHAGVLAEFDLETGAGAPLPATERGAYASARDVLAQGYEVVREERADRRFAAGLGLGVALAATAGIKTAPITRRRLLRAALQTAGMAALAPVLGFSFASEIIAPDELRALDTVAGRLALLAGPELSAGS
jgi:endonuclease/exonuclease/phosphatase family metal-dependent hydrolase